MCLAMLALPGEIIPEDNLSTAWKANPDGGGYMFIDKDGALNVRKFMTMNEFLDAYRQDAEDNPQSPFGVHVRIATHGDVNIDNAHPFWMDAETAVLHNGIIHCQMFKGDGRSDTRTFVEDYLTELPSTWMDSVPLTDMVEDYIGYSKMVVLTINPDAKHHWYICNEGSGDWKDGVWYSNKSYQPKMAKTARPRGSRSKQPVGSGLGGGWLMPDDWAESEAGDDDTDNVVGRGLVTGYRPPQLTQALTIDDCWQVLDELDYKCDYCGTPIEYLAVCFNCEICFGHDDCDIWDCCCLEDNGIMQAYVAHVDKLSEEFNRAIADDEAPTHKEMI